MSFAILAQRLLYAWPLKECFDVAWVLSMTLKGSHSTVLGARSERKRGCEAPRTCPFTETVYFFVVFLCYPVGNSFEYLFAPGVLAAGHRVRVVFCLMLRNICTNGTDEYGAVVFQGLGPGLRGRVW